MARLCCKHNTAFESGSSQPCPLRQAGFRQTAYFRLQIATFSAACGGWGTRRQIAGCIELVKPLNARLHHIMALLFRQVIVQGPDGGVVTQRTANPCTPVRFRLGPPYTSQIKPQRHLQSRNGAFLGPSGLNAAALKFLWRPKEGQIALI